MKPVTLVALLLGAVFAVLSATLAPADPDLFWHLASGDWMIDNRALLQVDVFSHTRAGEPYWVGQWLGQVVLAAVFRAGGWLGIDLLRGALIGLAAFSLARAVSRVQPHAGWAIGPTLLALLVSTPFWGDRPQLFTLALFPVVLDVLLATRVDGRVRRLLILPVVIALWSNLHGAFPLGVALGGAFAVESWLSRRPERRAFLLAFLASAVAGLANPVAAGAYLAAGAYASGPSRLIVEEQPPDLTRPFGLLFMALFGAALAFAFLRKREGAEGDVSPLLWAGLVGPFLLLGLSVQRQLPYAAFVIAPYLAVASRAAVGGIGTAGARVGRRVAAGATVVIIAGASAIALALAPRQPDLSAYPVGAEQVLREGDGPLLNEYDWGGYLIRFAPGTPTFIDGRGAVLFPAALLQDFDRVIGLDPSADGILTAHGIERALLRPGRPLAVSLRERGWSVRAEQQGSWVLLERP